MTERVMKWIKTEALIAEGDCVIAGVSGGADSVPAASSVRAARETTV